jgi:hypothetical protein
MTIFGHDRKEQPSILRRIVAILFGRQDTPEDELGSDIQWYKSTTDRNGGD